MAWATAPTFVAATVLQASNLNIMRDDLTWLATDSPACRAYHNTTQAVSNTIVTSLSLNSERFDNAAVHSTSSNTSRLTVPTGGGGKYLIGGSWSWAISASGAYRQGRVKVSGTAYAAILSLQPSASHASEGFITTSYALADADYVELAAVQDSGGSLNVQNAANYSPEFWCYWLRT